MTVSCPAFAIVTRGEILPTTLMDTERGAMVNWLVTYCKVTIMNSASDAQIAEAFEKYQKLWGGPEIVRIAPVKIVLMEELGFAERGTAWKEVLAGTFDLDGDLPVNPDGGLKAFGHPIGASGLRMMFEAWLQLRGEAPPQRRITTLGDRRLALTHNLGGYPGEMLSFVSILGTG